MQTVIMSGVSSFTGYWFAKELKEAGVETIGTLTREINEYTGLERARIELLQARGVVIRDQLPTQSKKYLELLDSFDRPTLALHGAPTAATKNADYVRTISEIYATIPELFFELKQKKGSVIVTESAYQYLNKSVSRDYGIAKAVLSEIYTGYAEKLGLDISRFVIGNPFGPLQGGRLASYIMECLSKQHKVELKKPDDIQNNQLIFPLAREYSALAQSNPKLRPRTLVPIQYVETNRQFLRRLTLGFKEYQKLIAPKPEAIDAPEIYLPLRDGDFKKIYSQPADWKIYFEQTL